MIDLYSGTPGAGKSLHAAMTIYWHLRRGLPVIANFPIEPGYIRGYKNNFFEVNNSELRPEILYGFSAAYFVGNRFKEEKILLVIDEAQLIFNARTWDAKDRAGWLSFFTQHRKYGYHIILIAQFDRMLDRQIRSLIEYEYTHRKVSNFGIFGKILSLLSFGSLFVAVKVWYPLKEKVGSDFYRAKRRYLKLYNSYRVFDRDLQDNNAESDSNTGNAS